MHLFNLPFLSSSFAPSAHPSANSPCQVNVIQDEALKQPISLAGSTLRGVHPCHLRYMANMGSDASLVMAVIINDNDDDGNAGGAQNRGRKLWGLVVCHHSTPRYVPFPLRSACEFLMQVGKGTQHPHAGRQRN